MIRLVLLTAAVLYVAMIVAPAPVEAERSKRSDESTIRLPDFSLASFVSPPSSISLPDDMVSDADAVTLAAAAGAALREARERPESMRGLIAAVEAEPTADDLQAVSDLWSVSGTLVNLRSGPSTQESVVSQVTLGTKALVVNETDGWYEIETADGTTTGWIFAKFLERES